MRKDSLNRLVAGKIQPSRKRIVEWPEGIRFLISHENKTVRKFIKGCLKGMGCPTLLELVPTGGNILITVVQEQPHVLICSGETPEMKDWSLVRSIRNHPEVSKTKVIVVSGDSARESILGAVKAGVDDYVILPFSASNFEERVWVLFARGLE
ncbi:MAG: response regulator [Candidatus Tectomicrobia bacterium]|uniref:Response regulator n=1 Tax=Tectimicrobiota bacterium TaxID=2528274 RepID=A0A932M287_UNCTE|nr:response regulator [Candidatus Tectomicrobia bacterium]